MQAIPAAISNFEVPVAQLFLFMLFATRSPLSHAFVMVEVGTEQWRTDLSDVVLPTPAYDSDSD